MTVTVKVIHNFDPDPTNKNEDGVLLEIPIRKGEIVTVLSQEEGWWEGIKEDGSRGLFPVRTPSYRHSITDTTTSPPVHRSTAHHTHTRILTCMLLCCCAVIQYNYVTKIEEAPAEGEGEGQSRRPAPKRPEVSSAAYEGAKMPTRNAGPPMPAGAKPVCSSSGSGIGSGSGWIGRGSGLIVCGCDVVMLWCCLLLCSADEIDPDPEASNQSRRRQSRNAGREIRRCSVITAW